MSVVISYKYDEDSDYIYMSYKTANIILMENIEKLVEEGLLESVVYKNKVKVIRVRKRPYFTPYKVYKQPSVFQKFGIKEPVYEI